MIFFFSAVEHPQEQQVERKKEQNERLWESRKVIFFLLLLIPFFLSFLDFFFRFLFQISFLDFFLSFLHQSSFQRMKYNGILPTVYISRLAITLEELTKRCTSINIKNLLSEYFLLLLLSQFAVCVLCNPVLPHSFIHLLIYKINNK